ncbi:MAG TPA: tetraacyldisaccharide 4'-kinase [Polyangiaceae bacterium]|jgi:tetraacyldisaccharide 4'-kinase
MSVRLEIARRLEAGTWRGPLARGLATGWGALASRSLARPLVWPAEVKGIAIGGATLGGGGKTPLAIACTAWLAAQGARAAYVGHGYRARPGLARFVSPADPLAEVGDEALLAARALAGQAFVVVAPSRQAAVDLAATRADVLVVDGVLQTTPRRASLSLLALGEEPWSRALPPAGDLRAPRAALLAACDHPVQLRPDARYETGGAAVPLVVPIRSRGAFHGGEFLLWSALAPLRVGLFTALAHPSRVLGALAREGVVPIDHVAAADHGPAPTRRRFLAPGRVDLWLASPKCALHLEAARIPHAVLEHGLSIPPSLAGVLRTHLGALTPLGGRR